MKRRIRLTENDLHRIIKRSVNRVLREAEYDDQNNYDSMSVYRAVDARIAQRVISGDYMLLAAPKGGGNMYGPGIYVTLEPRQHPIYDMPNQVWLEISVPSSAVKIMHSKRDGDFGIIRDPSAIYQVKECGM